jgi:hypothetical protein
MIFWIKKSARILSGFVFFAIFLTAIDPAEPFDLYTLSFAAYKGLLGAFLFWLLGYVLGDIILKGLVEEVKVTKLDLVDGGLLQHISTAQQENVPQKRQPWDEREAEDSKRTDAKEEETEPKPPSRKENPFETAARTVDLKRDERGGGKKAGPGRNRH